MCVKQFQLSGEPRLYYDTSVFACTPGIGCDAGRLFVMPLLLLCGTRALLPSEMSGLLRDVWQTLKRCYGGAGAAEEKAVLLVLCRLRKGDV